MLITWHLCKSLSNKAVVISDIFRHPTIHLVMFRKRYARPFAGAATGSKKLGELALIRYPNV